MDAHSFLGRATGPAANRPPVARVFGLRLLIALVYAMSLAPTWPAASAGEHREWYLLYLVVSRTDSPKACDCPFWRNASGRCRPDQTTVLPAYQELVARSLHATPARHLAGPGFHWTSLGRECCRVRRPPTPQVPSPPSRCTRRRGRPSDKTHTRYTSRRRPRGSWHRRRRSDLRLPVDHGTRAPGDPRPCTR